MSTIRSCRTLLRLVVLEDRAVPSSLLGTGSSVVLSWVDLLNGGGWSRADVVMGVLNSAEYRGLQVDHFFRAYLGRQAGAAEREAWINYLQQGGTEEGLTVAFLSSAEYQAQFPDNAAFVRSLYDRLLYRYALDTEVTGWVNVLNAGVSRETVVWSFLHSREASMRAVDTVTTFLRRDADPAGGEGFANQLQQPDGKVGDVMQAVQARVACIGSHAGALHSPPACSVSSRMVGRLR
jgi:hypothetical protein